MYLAPCSLWPLPSVNAGPATGFLGNSCNLSSSIKFETNTLFAQQYVTVGKPGFIKTISNDVHEPSFLSVLTENPLCTQLKLRIR